MDDSLATWTNRSDGSQKWARVSDLLRSLTKCLRMSKSLHFLSKSLICLKSAKYEWFAHFYGERIPNPVF